MMWEIMTNPRTATATARGRVELIGNHTDYNGGSVLTLASPTQVTATARDRDDRRCTLASKQYETVIHDELSQLRHRSSTCWASHLIGVLVELMDGGLLSRGLDISIDGDLPQGAGMGSSAAVALATLSAVSKLRGIAMSPSEMARTSQRAEHRFAGVQSGLMDQLASLHGEMGNALAIDCTTFETEALALPQAAGFVIVDSGVRHRLRDTPYDDRRRACERGAAALGVGHLGEIESWDEVTANAAQRRALDRLDPDALTCSEHVVRENQRVRAARSAIARGDLDSLGALMLASHESSRTLFRNSVSELDDLVTWSHGIDRVYGARLTGGGFGGAIVTLVERSAAPEYIDRLRKTYRQRGRPQPAVLASF